MPHVWTSEAPVSSAFLPAETVSAMLDVASAPADASRLLRVIRTVVPVAYLSLVSVQRDAPELVEGCACHPPDDDVVSHCFVIYRRRYYRQDAMLPLASALASQPASGMAMLYCRADELPDAGWRSDIYERQRLADRFTLLHSPTPGQVQAIHVYRDDQQGPLQCDELDRLLGLSPFLRQAHAAAWRVRGTSADHRSLHIATCEQRLRRLAPGLSARECAVCARIAQGMSADGIAADLDVAPSTVVTLRKRAYLKLAEAGLPAERLGLARLLH